MKRVPYGESNYKKVIDNDMYYIDKTKYIETLEMMPSYQFFIRPRKFGKSLFLSMLETYYDVNEKDKFEHYFGNLYIGKNKTTDANNYLVMRLSFAGILTDQGKEEIINGFNQTVYLAVKKMFEKYSNVLKIGVGSIENTSGINILKVLNNVLVQNNQKLMLLIDEYDNFANGLMIKNEEMYKDLVQTDGFVKSFYKEIKEGTAEGAIVKVFITGVSPILLDDLTSGANVFENISNEYMLNSIMGVTQEELEEMISHYKLDNYVEKNELITTMKELYNGYRFNKKAQETIYNTGMVMYLANKMNLNKEFPDNMLDDNIKTDYGKIRTLAKNFESKDELRDIIENNRLIGPMEIKTRFGIENLFTDTNKSHNFESLMYYLGLLTIKKSSGIDVYLGIPNYSVKTMYWEYLYNAYEVGNYKRMDEIKLSFKKMRKEADVKDVMKIYKEVRAGISNRDLIKYNEMTSKGVFITLIFADNVYIMESEKEHREGYSDLYLKDGVTYKDEVKYRYLIEFKHIKEKERTEELLEANKTKAKEQIEKYIKDYRLKEDGEKPLKKMIVITIGKDDMYYEELN